MPRRGPEPGPLPFDVSEWGIFRLWTLRHRAGECEPQIMWTYHLETPLERGYSAEEWDWKRQVPRKVTPSMEVDANGDLYEPDPPPPAEALALAAPHLAPIIESFVAEKIAQAEDARNDSVVAVSLASAGFGLPERKER